MKLLPGSENDILKCFSTQLERKQMQNMAFCHAEKNYFDVYSVPALKRNLLLLLQAGGREVVKGSGIYKMVDPTMPTQSCSSAGASAATGGITNDMAVKEATRQRLRSMRNKAVRDYYGLSDPL